MSIVFLDPFERVISFVADSYNVSAKVMFVDPSEFLSRIGPLGLRKPKGETFWPDDGGRIEIRISAKLRRGVAGTLDILAHELAHAVAGPDAGHGPRWLEVYDSIYKAACEQPFVERSIGLSDDSGPYRSSRK